MEQRQSVNSTKYKWERYWWLRGEEGRVRFDPAGFLLDPDGGFWSNRDTGLRTLPSLESFGCLALIGEPGSGKSTALGDERDRLIGLGKRPIYCDLRSVPDAAGLREKITEFSVAVAQHSTEVLLLDSLDECRIEVRLAADMIAEALESMGSLRPRAKICCRSADWPQTFEDCLSRLYGPGGFGVYVMAPLRRRDVIAALDAEGLDSGAFFDQVVELRLIPLAIKPLTLGMLLADFGSGKGLSSDQAAVIERGCLKLCEESQERYYTPDHHGSLTPQQRLEIAKRIAATMLLTGREYIGTGQGCGSEPGVVALSELVDRTTRRDDVLETLNTGLFVAFGPERHGWYHKLPEEFLAARFLAERSLPLDQVRSLFVQNSQIVPQLREAASWLAQMRSDFLDYLLATDPKALVAADAQLPSDEARSRVTDSLLGLHAAGRNSRLDWSIIDGFSKLAHPELHSQLKAALSRSSMPVAITEIALLIALKCQVREVAEHGANLALDTTRPIAIRRIAAEVVATVGSEPAKHRLRSLASSTEADDELRASALSALWPAQLQAAELFDALVPPSAIVIGGGYDRFLRDLPGSLQEDDLVPALDWLANLRSLNDRRSALGDLARAVFALAIACQHIDGVSRSLALAAIEFVRQGEDLRPVFERSPESARLDLLERCLDILQDSGLRASHCARAAGLRLNDIPAGLLRASQSEDLEKKIAIAEVLLLIPGALSAHFGSFADAAARDEVLKGAFKDVIGPIALSSPLAAECRRAAQYDRDRRQRETEHAQAENQRLAGAVSQLRAAACSLWNTPSGRKPTHKTEPQISAFIAHDLNIRLRNSGIVVSREIEIKPERNRKDIHVTAMAVEGGHPVVASVTIEAKGSWNPGLRSSMREQLLQQYLDGTTCNHGIYLVYWVGEGPRLAELRGQLQAEAALLSTGIKQIQVIVLDCSLPARKDRRQRPSRHATATR